MGGGGNRTPEELTDDESVITQPELPLPCEACFSAYARARTISDLKYSILRYKPGDLIEELDGIKVEDYEIPDITTILMIGPKGSGKTTLTKRIVKLFDSDIFISDSDEELCNSSGEFTVFMKEYKIPKRVSSSICIYDTPGLVQYLKDDNFNMIEHWMKKGVRNGDSYDKGIIKNNEEKKSQPKRKVNYAIFVIDAISVMKYLEDNDNDDGNYINFISDTFKYPVLTFKDKKPAVVITHGDKLSSLEFNYVCDFIQELLCVNSTQIFNISGSDDYETELNILHLMHYCIDKADKNLQLKPKSSTQGGILQWSVRMIERLVIYDKIMDAIIVFLCIIVLLIKFWGYIW